MFCLIVQLCVSLLYRQKHCVLISYYHSEIHYWHALTFWIALHGLRCMNQDLETQMVLGALLKSLSNCIVVYTVLFQCFTWWWYFHTMHITLSVHTDKFLGKETDTFSLFSLFYQIWISLVIYELCLAFICMTINSRATVYSLGIKKSSGQAMPQTCTHNILLLTRLKIK